MADETETTAAEEPQDISGLFDDDTRTDEGAEASEADSEVETGEQEAEAEADAESDTEAAQQAEEADAESSQEADTEAEAQDSETPSEREGESVPRQALLDERRKRQEAQEQVEKLRREYGVQSEEDDAPDPRDDPEGYEKHVREKVERENWEKRANASRERMLEQHSDYEDKERHFLMLAQKDQDLIRQMNEHPDPAKFAYDKASESLTEQEKAVEDRVIERLRKEGRLKDEASGEGQSGKGRSKTASASKVADLTSSAGAGNNSSEQIPESQDPADVFGDLAY